MTKNEVIINTRRNLLIYADRNGISDACKNFGISRTTFYKIKKQFLLTGDLAPKTRAKPIMPNQASLTKKKMLLKLVQKFPSFGPLRYAYEFRKEGIFISASGVYYILKRFGLNKRFKRLVYLEKLKSKNIPLTERSLKIVKTECKKIETGLWPGHVVALDTLYVGTIKNVGRIYQLTGIDLCSRFGWAKLYKSKEQINTLDFVENILLPKFYLNRVNIENVLTDNGKEFIGSKVRNMLIDYDIKHKRIKPGKPICNAYCERFQRTILEEFYYPIFRQEFFTSLEELEKKLQEYLVYYNFERAHFGLDKNGAIPIEVFKSKKSVLQQRFAKLLT